jgi:AAA+ superfamily predicted ATPase
MNKTRHLKKEGLRVVSQIPIRSHRNNDAARTLANEGGLTFISATTAEAKAKFLGQSGNRIKLLFERAQASSPSILSFDELGCDRI